MFNTIRQKSEVKTINLNPVFIEDYVNKGEGSKIIVLWNGASDKNILNRLNLGMLI